VSRADFWQMDPAEVWWMIEAKQPKEEGETYAGTLTQRDVDELSDFLKNEGLLH
jgi:hypothetical protein